MHVRVFVAPPRGTPHHLVLGALRLACPGPSGSGQTPRLSMKEANCGPLWSLEGPWVSRLSLAWCLGEGTCEPLQHPRPWVCRPEDMFLEAWLWWLPCVHRLIGTVAKKHFLTNTPGLRAEGPDRNSRLPGSPERGTFVNFKSCCLGVQLPVSLHLGADGDPPFGTPPLPGPRRRKQAACTEGGLRAKSP